MPANHIKRTWQGEVTWAAGEESEARFLVVAGTNALAGQTATPTSWGQLMQLDLSGYNWAGMHIYGKKIAHGDTMTFAERWVHGAMGIQGLPAIGPSYANGSYEPKAWCYGGTVTTGNLNFVASRGGIHDSMTLGNESSADVTYWTGDPATQVNNQTQGLVVPYDRLAVGPKFTASATALTGTNTWLVQVTLYACR